MKRKALRPRTLPAGFVAPCLPTNAPQASFIRQARASRRSLHGQHGSRGRSRLNGLQFGQRHFGNLLGYQHVNVDVRLYYPVKWRKNADEFLPRGGAPVSRTDEALRTEWELEYLVSKRLQTAMQRDAMNSASTVGYCDLRGSVGIL
jgi:hypothetical protein